MQKHQEVYGSAARNPNGTITDSVSFTFFKSPFTNNTDSAGYCKCRNSCTINKLKQFLEEAWKTAN